MIEPQTYLITFHTYGTWLHGDKKGSVDRFHNRYDTEVLRENESRKKISARSQKLGKFTLNLAQRRVVKKTVQEVSEYRSWDVVALNVRTNHIHVVVSGFDQPEKMLNDFKSYSTRRLRKAGLANHSEKIWLRHGSTRYLFDEHAVEEAARYVLEGQGCELL